MIEISEKQVSVIAQDNIVPAYLTIGGIQQEYRVTQIDSSFSSYEGRKFLAELEKVSMYEGVTSVKVEDKVETKEPKLKGYKLNPNYTPAAGDYLHGADWDYGEIEELVAMTPKSWWYSYESKLKYGFEGYEILLFSDETFGTARAREVPWGARRIFKSDILIPMYNPENVVAAFNGLPFTCGNIKITVVPQPKKEQPELKYTELWMADTSNDTLDTTMGYLTNGKVYDVLSLSFIQGRQQFEVVCDNGYVYYFHNGWFKPVRLYDEDESELICRDIEFGVGDYIDLRKHTQEQIRHIAKFYKFFNVDTLFNSHVTYDYVIYRGFLGWSGHNRVGLNDKEYTYDDIFYSEEV